MQNFRRDWYAVLVRMLCYMLSFVDRQMLGLLLPAMFTDYIFRTPSKTGYSIALTMTLPGILMFVIFAATLRPYRTDYHKMHGVAGSA